MTEFRGGRSDAIFLSTLRDSIKSNVRASTETWRGPEITDYLHWTTPKVQAMQKQAVTRQKKLVDRLSPKRAVVNNWAHQDNLLETLNNMDA